MDRCPECGLAMAVHEYSGAPLYGPGREKAIYGSGKEVLFKRCLGRLARRFPARGRLLDVGSAYGDFMGMAKADGWNAEGIEIEPAMFRSAAAAGFNVHDRPIEELGLRKDSYEAVTVFEVLSLMEDPFKAVAEIYRVLKPGGMVCIREFNGAFHMALAGRRVFRALGLRPAVVHGFNFTDESLRKMLLNAGFRHVRIENSPTTTGDPYGTGGRMGARLTGIVKFMYYCAAQVVYYASLGRVLSGSSLMVEAEK